MTPGGAVVVLNPDAGGGRGAARARRVADRLVKQLPCPARLIRTSELDPALRDEADPQTLWVLVGGDGTLHHGVNWLKQGLASPLVGLIPAGSGNDYARSAGVPADVGEAAAALLAAVTTARPARTVDLIRAGERWVVNELGAGLDAEVARLVAGRPSRSRSSYLATVPRLLSRPLPSADVSVEIEGRFEEAELCVLAVCNGTWAGGLFPLAPGAVIDDGRLDVLLVAGVSRLRALALLPALLAGRHVGRRGVRLVRARQVRARFAPGLPLQADGEPLAVEATAIDARIAPAAMRLLV